MPFQLPSFTPPDFSRDHLKRAPLVTFRETGTDGVLPENYHITSIFPEYYHLQNGGWQILKDSRMDCAVVRGADLTLQVKEARNIRKGELVACGRGENGGPPRELTLLVLKREPGKTTTLLGCCY